MPGTVRRFESVIGSEFDGSVVSTNRCGPFPAIIAEVSGQAHYSGEASFWQDGSDEIGRGFIVR